MNDYVLFSLIGNSDPVRDSFDGPFLHIVRHYKPKKAIIFLTSEMLKHHKNDNRFRIFAQRVHPECEIETIEKPDFDDPSDYIKADKYIKEALNKVCEENRGKEIIINISSGTPQMTGSLYLHVATSKEKLKMIQVVTPEKKGNKSKPVGEDFNLKWEMESLIDDPNNIDPGEGVKNRCKEVTPDNIRYKIDKEIIESHVNGYDYYAAQTVVELALNLFDEKLLTLLKAGHMRYSMNYKEAADLAKNAGYSFSTVVAGDARDIFEGILYLDIKLRRQELNEFARAVSPALTELFKAYLRNAHNIDIVNFCIKNRKEFLEIKRDKIKPPELQAAYDEHYNPVFKDSPLAFSNIMPAVEFYCGKDTKYAQDLKNAKDLRTFEDKVRNLAAHQLKGLTAEQIKNDYGFTPQEVLEKLKYIFRVSFVRYAKQINWNSYDEMNENLLKILE